MKEDTAKNKVEDDFIESNRFFENDFSKKITELSSDNIQKDIGNKQNNIDNKDVFIRECFYYIIEIHDKCDDINSVFMHIKHYPDDKEYRKIFPINKYSSYHIETYYIRIIGLFDRILHLINFLYGLRLEGSGLKLKNVKKYEIDSEIIIILEKFYNKTEELRNSQNYFKHEGTLKIEELERVGTYEFLLNHSKDLSKEERIGIQKFIDVTFDLYKNKLKKSTLNNAKNVAIFVNNILDKLYLQFEKRLNEI